MARAVWTPLAEEDLEEILVHIRVADGRPLTARRNAEETQEAVNKRAALGTPGQIHPAAPDGWFYFRFKRWLIFYRPFSDGIEILRIIDATRDLPKHFNQ